MSSKVSQPSNQDCQLTGSSSQQKVKLHVNKYNQLVGEGSNKFKSNLGKLVRTHIPITYHDWRVVPDAYKEDVWNDAMVINHKLPFFPHFFGSFLICFECLLSSKLLILIAMAYKIFTTTLLQKDGLNA